MQLSNMYLVQIVYAIIRSIVYMPPPGAKRASFPAAKVPTQNFSHFHH
jgi:hypothetical protein